MTSLEQSIFFSDYSSTSSVSTATSATGTITITDYANILDTTAFEINDNAEVINHYAYLEAGGGEWTLGASNDATASNLAAAINNRPDELITASVTANVITLTAIVPGTLANSYIISTDDETRVTLSGDYLSGGTD